MCVRRSDWERVTEREELVGRLRVGSRFPQYFTTAMLTGAVVLARKISRPSISAILVSRRVVKESTGLALPPNQL